MQGERMMRKAVVVEVDFMYLFFSAFLIFRDLNIFKLIKVKLLYCAGV